MLDGMFMQVIDMTKTGSIVILVIIVARLLLRRAPKIFSYVLWLVVLFRLLCPVSFEIPVSIVPEFTPVAEGYGLADESISIAGATEAAYRAVGDAVNGGLGIQHIRTTQRSDSGGTIYASTDWWDVWILFGQYIWVLGVLVMAGYSIVSYGRLRRKLSVKICLHDNIYIADDIQTPFVKGIVKPKIYLPPGLREQEQDYIIRHEQYHIKRKDPFIKILAFLALCIHWFNPLVWVAFVLANKDMEMSCDEAVIRKLGPAIRADYAASLLTLSTGRYGIAGISLAFCEGNTKSRIRNLAKWKKPAAWIMAVSVIICVVLVISLIGDPVSGDPAVANMNGELEKDSTYDVILINNDDVAKVTRVCENENGETEETSEIFYNAGSTIMTPTQAAMTGAFDNYLYVPLDGQTYRYERTDMGLDSVTKDKLIYSFTEEAEPQNVDWKGYALKEYPDKRAVLAVAGADYEYVYKYSPSKRSEPDALNEALESGYVVHMDGDVTSGQEIWESFVKDTSQGKTASVQVAEYYTLDKESCSEEYYAAYQEDYPILFLFDLTFDGSTYTLKWKEGDKEYIRQFQYLMHYTGEAPTWHATYDTYSRYVLTNDNKVTWEELQKGMFSSQLGDYIEYHTVYTDLQ